MHQRNMLLLCRTDAAAEAVQPCNTVLVAIQKCTVMYARMLANVEHGLGACAAAGCVPAAADALKHPYFSAAPPPTPAHRLPKPPLREDNPLTVSARWLLHRCMLSNTFCHAA
jgi:hypothetical protein